MATIEETFVLVERDGSVPDTVSGHPHGPIVAVLRTFLSTKRAEQDLELLNSQRRCNQHFEVLSISHIDD